MNVEGLLYNTVSTGTNHVFHTLKTLQRRLVHALRRNKYYLSKRDLDNITTAVPCLSYESSRTLQWGGNGLQVLPYGPIRRQGLESTSGCTAKSTQVRNTPVEWNGEGHPLHSITYTKGNILPESFLRPANLKGFCVLRTLTKEMMSWFWTSMTQM